MADNQFVLRGAPGAFVALLSAARAQGATITRTKLAKLLYLADLRAVENLGRPESGVEWRWLHYGPYSNNLLTIEDDLARDSIVERASCETWAGSIEHRLRLLRMTPVVIDDDFASLIEQIVLEYGGLAASTLRDMTYQTAPMLEAQREGSRGDVLDLLTGRSVPDIAPALQRLSRVLNRLEPQSDEGDLAGLADEMNAWTEPRARATGLLLADE